MENNGNHKQDIKINTVEIKIENLEQKVDKFIDNDFWHFKESVDKKFNAVFTLVVIGILVPIALYLLK